MEPSKARRNKGHVSPPKAPDRPSPKESPKKGPPPSDRALHLHYPRIRAQLAASAAGRDSLLLLQALRWRLTRTTAAVRRGQLSSFVQGDLLSLKRPSQAWLGAALEGEEAREATARLLNSLASTKAGRAYLASSSDDDASPVAIATAAVKRKDSGPPTQAKLQLLAALQKLSMKLASPWDTCLHC